METIETLRLIAPEFKSYTDDELKSWISLSEPFVNKKAFGKFYNQALAYLTAHKMKMGGLGDTSHGTVGDSVRIASVSEGDVSISFSGNQASTDDADAEYLLTHYGIQYLAIRKAVIFPVVISHKRLIQKMAVSYSIKSTAEGDQLLKQLKELCGLEVVVGYQKGDKREKETEDDKKSKSSAKNKNKSKKKKNKRGSLRPNSSQRSTKEQKAKSSESKIDKSNDEPDLLDIAAWNEFGTPTAPARPFMAQSFDNNVDYFENLANECVQQVINGSSASSVLKIAGNSMKAIVQKTIDDGDFEPNSESTILRKGSDKPLIDKGIMRSSVHFQTRPKGSGGDE